MSVYSGPRDRVSRHQTAQRFLAVLLSGALILSVQIFSRIDFFDKHVNFAAGYLNGTFSGKTATVDFLDVGQGSATLICFPDGKTLLVDTGPKSSRDTLIGYLDARGVSTLDCLVVTHQHGDHADNVEAVLDHVDVRDVVVPDAPEREMLDPKRYQKMNANIKAAGLVIRRPVQGEMLLAGEDYSVTVLSDDQQNYPALNDYSIVLKVVIGKVSFLLMADAEKTTESQLLAEGIALDCDFLQVGHHGNKNGETEAFLEAVTPLVSVISVGKNTFGQPYSSVIGRLKDAGSSVYRTDFGGTITVITDGASSRIECSVI